MSETDRAKWDARYRAGDYAGRGHPTALLAEWEPVLPGGRALDVACGVGRNSLFLAATGRAVEAIDISTVALERARHAAVERGVDVRWIEADLDAEPDAALPDGPYGAIVLVRYVNVRLMPLLVGRLAHGGMLLVEQHLESSEDVVGPRNPAFRLRRNALLREVTAASIAACNVLYYREGPVTDPDGRRAALAQLVVQRV